MSFKTWALVATRSSFSPCREDRRQTARGGLAGPGDLEDEDRRHLAVLVAAGPAPPPSTMVYSQWTGPMPMASAFLPFQSTNPGLPPPKKSTPWRGGEGEANRRDSGK